MNRWLLLAIVIGIGCKDDTKTAPEKKQEPAETKKTEGDEPAPKKKKPAKPAASAPAPKPLDVKEKTAVAAYFAGMKKGRALTLKKDYSAAIAAFDDALKARPDDARALSERGYAKLLAKDWDAARSDLERAQKRSTDRVLQAQIWYNLGLVEEGKGDAEAAKSAFAKSNELNPTTAAKKKLEGKEACSASVDGGASTTKSYAGWKALWDDLAKEYEKDWGEVEDKPKDDAAARKLMCEDCKGDGPNVAWFGKPWVQMRWYLVTSDGGKLVAFEGNEAGMGGRCTWTPDVRIESDGDLVHVVQMGEPQIPELVGVDGGDCKPEGECQSACAVASWERVDAVYDPSAKKRVIRVEQNAAFKKGEGPGDKHAVPVTVKVNGKTVSLSGGGCDRQIK